MKTRFTKLEAEIVHWCKLGGGRGGGQIGYLSFKGVQRVMMLPHLIHWEAETDQEDSP